MKVNLNNKSILITGGTGSFGSTFVSSILKNYKPKRIIIFSRDEQKHFKMQDEFLDDPPSPVRYFLGDVRDLDRLNLAMQNVDIVVHTAALKHVPLAEYNPFEVVKTNILGAQNIIQSAIQNKVKKVIALSTDKASSPINLYGATKLVSDKLFIAANNYKGNTKIKFSVVRYGNVMGSKGSFISYLIKNKNKKFISVTNQDMTRFNITLNESVDFVLNCIDKMWGGEIFVPKIPSYKVTDLVKAISPKSKIKIVGIRPGEKKHEEMVSIDESINTIEFKNYFVIAPNSKFLNWNKKKYILKNKNCKPCKNNFSYNSKNNSKFLSPSDLRKIINKNKVIF